MKKTYDAELTRLLKRGLSLTDALKKLREQGVAPVPSIMAMVMVKGISIGAAKELLIQSKVWDDVIKYSG